MKEEVWKDIKGYEGIYQVSNHGEVKSFDRKDACGMLRKGRVLKNFSMIGGIFNYIFIRRVRELKFLFTV